MVAAGRPLTIVAPAPQVAKAFEITGLDQILPLRSAA
jgi:anti-anti-sigma regulatory factor